MKSHQSEGKISIGGITLLLVVLVLLAAGALAGSLVTAMTGHTPFRGTGKVPVMVGTDPPVPAGKISFATGFEPVVEKIRDGVVNISSTKIVHPQKGQMQPFFNDPFFRQFFGPFSAPRPEREHSLGSGVIVSRDGYVLTNNHVVQGASEIKVYFPDHREFKGKIVGTDAKTDIAVVKVDATNLPALVLGDSSKMHVGDFVLAAGDPFGIGETFTMGIVSATGRGGLGIEQYEDFIQTDAAINPGNSGGALVNVHGEVIGINTAILSRGGGGNEGIGFAIPINMARQVMNQIIQHGKVIRGWLGVAVQPVTQQIAQAFGLKKAGGALVADVEPDSPASKAGLQRGDVIIDLNGKPIADSRDLSLKVAEIAPGTTVDLKVIRNHAQRDISVKLGEMPNKGSGGQQGGGGGNTILQGLAVDRLTPNTARQLGLPAYTKGVVITDVTPGSVADEAGLRRGDVIEEVDRKRVTTVSGFENAINAAGNKPVLLLVNRGGNTMYIAVAPQ